MLLKAAAASSSWPVVRTAGVAAARWRAAQAATSRPLSAAAAAASSPDRADADNAAPLPLPSSSPSSSSAPTTTTTPTTTSTTTPTPFYALDDDQRAFQQLAADFARERLAPHSAEWDERSVFPIDVFREAAALGFAGLFVPERLGGTGLSRLSAAVVFEALAQGDVPFSAYLSIHNMVAGAVAGHAEADAARFGGGGDKQVHQDHHHQNQNQSRNQNHHRQRRAALLARLCSMESFAAYCLTEPNSGSDAASLGTTATRATCPQSGVKGWSLRGSKSFISGAGVADVYLVMARVVGRGDEGSEGGDGSNVGNNGGNGGNGASPQPPKPPKTSTNDPAKGVTAFIVDRKRPEGFDASSLTFGAPEKKMGWRMQPTAAVHLDGAFVPDADVVGPLGEGFRAVALKALDGGRVNIGACSVGGAQSALTVAARYARERRQFGVRVGDFQATRFRLADAATDVEAARLLVRRAAAALDRVNCRRGGGVGGLDGGAEEEEAQEDQEEASALAAMAKRFASDKCFDAANAALQTFGGYGYLRDYGVERVVRDLRVHSLLEGTNEVMRLVVAKKLPLFVEAAAATAGGVGA